MHHVSFHVHSVYSIPTPCAAFGGMTQQSERQQKKKKEKKPNAEGKPTLVAMFRYRKKNIRKESNMGKQYEGLAEHMLASEIFGDLEKAYIKAQLLIKY